MGYQQARWGSAATGLNGHDVHVKHRGSTDQRLHPWGTGPRCCDVRAGRPSLDLTFRSPWLHTEPSIADYDERRGPLVEYWKAQNGRQSGDPAKLARALITIASQAPPPRRFIAGAGAIATAEQKIADLKAEIDANRELSMSLAFD
jgi:hypothetical protein